jgi:hypothetical protein
VQAIHTKDRHLLEKVLNIGQEQIIFGTVTRLQQDHVLPFLQLVLARFRGNPNRSVNLLVWIRAVFVEHVAYLSTVRASPSPRCVCRVSCSLVHALVLLRRCRPCSRR